MGQASAIMRLAMGSSASPTAADPREGRTATVAGVVLAVFCVLTVLAPHAGAQTSREKTITDLMVERLAEKVRELDPDNMVPTAARQLAEAICNVDNALWAVFDGNDASVKTLMQDAATDFDEAVGTLATVVANDNLRQASIPEFARGLLSIVGLFPEEPENWWDILQRIKSLAEKSRDAAQRIADGDETEGDLMIVVHSSSELSRLLAAFVQVVANT